MPRVSLFITAARSDCAFLGQMVPHIVRGCNYPFDEVLLVVDTAPLRGKFQGRSGAGRDAQLLEVAEDLRVRGVITDVVPVNYRPDRVCQVYSKYCSFDIGYTHHSHGGPVYPYFYGLDVCSGEYVVHLDSDMFIFTELSYSWVREGIRLLDEVEEVMFVLPLAGPPHPDGILHQGATHYTAKAKYYAFEATFTSRKFMLKHTKLEENFLPLKTGRLHLTSSQSEARDSSQSGQEAQPHFELLVSDTLAASPYVRADLRDPRCWSLHPRDHDELFLEHLGGLLRLVEANRFPQEQAGHYDLKFEAYLPLLA